MSEKGRKGGRGERKKGKRLGGQRKVGKEGRGEMKEGKGLGEKRR